MRRLDDTPIDPEMAACLDAIDATLAGEPVDPRHAELAELALLLADERPRPRPQFVAALDARAGRHFEPAPTVVAARAQKRQRRLRLGGAWGMASGLAAAAVVAVIALAGGGGGSSSATYSSASTPATAAVPGGASASSAGASSAGSSSRTPSFQGGGGTSTSSAGSGAQALSLPPNGRKTIQSAQLALSAAPSRIDAVAQEVFNVVGQANGIVDHSSVSQTGGSDGSATFNLRLPSSSLGQTLGELSDLSGAHVLSRTDNSQDVNSQYVSAARRLADDQALRTSLLRQLGAASTQQQIDSLKAQLRNAESSIVSDQNALNQLNAQVNYSAVLVTISAGQTPAPVAHHSSGGFTLGHSAHVAGRVLVIAAGVGLIALAGLLPVALLVALWMWCAALLRRRGREQALDLA